MFGNTTHAERIEAARKRREAGTLRLTRKRAIRAVAMWNAADNHYSRCGDNNSQMHRYKVASYVIDTIIDRFRINPADVPAAKVRPADALGFIERTARHYDYTGMRRADLP